MRLTINLDDDLYAMARSHAIAKKTSISKAVGDLLRRNTSPPTTNNRTPPNVHPLSGFPVSLSDSGRITDEDVQRSLDDELVRPLEIAGHAADELEEKLK